MILQITGLFFVISLPKWFADYDLWKVKEKMTYGCNKPLRNVSIAEIYVP